MPFFLLLSIPHYPFFLPFLLHPTLSCLPSVNTLPYRLTYITLPSPLHPTLLFLLSILHYPSCSPSYTTLCFSVSYTTLPSPLHPLLTVLFISIRHYPSFSPSYITLPSLLHPKLPFLLSIRHYSSFMLYFTTLPYLYPTLPFLLISILHYSSFSISYTVKTALFKFQWDRKFYKKKNGSMWTKFHCLLSAEKDFTLCELNFTVYCQLRKISHYVNVSYNKVFQFNRFNKRTVHYSAARKLLQLTLRRK